VRTIASFFLVLAMLGVLPLAGAAPIDGRSVVFETKQRPLTAELFSARGDGKRPAVVILHGVGGFDAFPAFYRRYAAALAGVGIDAYVLSYYDASDAVATKSKIADERRAVFNQRIRSWTSSVSEVVGLILADANSAGRVGVLGFSQGGFLATAAAAQDKRISALMVFYGANRNLPQDEITHLPPLLELHGDADRVVPLAEGRALVDLARGLGQPAEMIVYPGAGHGFDGADAVDAQRRTLAFFAQRLLKAPGK
jgi:carboxymethylenebutenolidase